MINIIVAYDKDYGIAKNGVIPWNIPTEMNWFAEVTKKSICIMGRKTWESLPNKPLIDRMNIVLSKTDSSYDYASLESALSALKNNKNKIYIIGGAQLFNYALDIDVVDNVIASEIRGKFHCDTFFPKLDKNKWNKFGLIGCSDFYTFRYSKKTS